MKVHTAGLLCTLLATATAFGDETTPTDWKNLARTDIEAGYQLLRENHPGTVDPRNPAFIGQLQRARRRALALTGKVNDSAGYAAALRAFSAVLNDGHAALRAPPTESLSWPGFMATWRSGDLQVFESTLALPAKGDRIVSCDGKSIRQLVERDVFSFNTHNGEASAWWRLAPELLLDTGNPFVKRPRQCTFVTSAGTHRSRLAWTAVESQHLYSLQRVATNGDRLPIGLSERGGIFWVALPTFAPTDGERQDYQRLFADLDARRAEWLRARALVLDLRHNGGGNSQWSVDTAAHLWGEPAVGAAFDAYFKGVQVWWRATAGNAARLDEYARESRERGDAAGAASLADLAAAMRTAQSRDEPFVVEPAGSGAAAPAGAPTGLGVPVYVVVPPQCASACLDALDLFTRFPGVKLIGAPSSTDSNYLDIRFETLPSGMSKVVIPMKVWVNRPRASGEGYVPAIEITELDWSTDTFVKRIEADLQPRAETGR